MVDVSGKEVTDAIAIAEARVVMRPRRSRGSQARGVAKGDVLGVARLAGIMGAKRTADLIPLCHPLALTCGHGRADCRCRDAPAVEITRDLPGAPAAPASRWRR